MRLIVPYLPRCVNANALLALQACVASALILGVCKAESESPPRFAQAFETLPSPGAPVEEEDGVPQCMTITDAPLSALSADIRPRNAEDRLITDEPLPVDCAETVFTDKRFLNVGLSCESCRPRWCDVLGLAHFCHRPLYFEEVCLERCGVRSCCCQPTASAAHFFGGALLMPMRAFCVCPCACVPAQYGCR